MKSNTTPPPFCLSNYLVETVYSAKEILEAISTAKLMLQVTGELSDETVKTIRIAYSRFNDQTPEVRIALNELKAILIDPQHKTHYLSIIQRSTNIPIDQKTKAEANPTASPPLPFILIESYQQINVRTPTPPLPPGIAATPPLANAQIPLPRIEKPAESKSKDPLRAMQEAMLTTFGEKTFNAYIRPLLPWLVENLFNLLEDPNLASLAAKSLIEMPLFNRLLDNLDTLKDAPNLLCTQFFAGLQSTLQSIIQKEIHRTEFSGLLSKRANIQNPKGKALGDFVFKNYVPEILEAFFRTELKSSEALIKELSSETLTPESLAVHLITQHLTVSCKEAGKVLCEKLNDERLNSELLPLLRALLLDLCFPQPANIKPLKKNIILNIGCNIVSFVTNWQKNDEQHRKLDKPRATIVLSMTTKFVAQKGTNYNRNPHHLDSLIQEIFKQIMRPLFFPEMKQSPGEISYMNKFAEALFSLYATILALKIITPTFLNLLIQRFLQFELTTKNPFDKAMPSLDTFDASDHDFSAGIEELIKELVDQLIKLYFEGGMINSALSTICTSVFNKWLKIPGDTVQRVLNKSSHSGAITMPFFLLSQILFKIQDDPHLLFTDSLAKAPPAFDLKALFNLTNKDADSLQKEINKKILKSPNILQAKLENTLPDYTGSFALTFLQKIYRFMRDGLFLKLLLAHILDGVKNGLINSK